MGAGPAPADARAAALDWAARCRDRRAALEAALDAGQVDLAHALGPEVAGDDQLGLTKVLVVLEALPGARKVDTRRRLAELGVPAVVAVADLSDAQRELLLASFPLPGRGPA